MKEESFGNVLLYIKNLDKLGGIQEINLQENAHYYLKTNDGSFRETTYLMSETFLILIARFASPNIIKEAFDKWTHDIKKDIPNNSKALTNELRNKHFLSDNTNSFGFFLGALFTQEPKVIKEVMLHVKKVTPDFICQVLFEEDLREKENDDWNTRPFSHETLTWLENKNDKNLKEKLDIFFDFLESFLGKKQIPLYFIYQFFKSETSIAVFFEVIKKRQYEPSIDLTSYLIHDENENFKLASDITIKKAINQTIIIDFFEACQNSYNKTYENSYYKYLSQKENQFQVYNNIKHTQENQNILFILSHFSLDNTQNKKLNTDYLVDLNDLLGTQNKNQLSSILKTYNDAKIFNEEKVALDDVVIHFMKQLNIAQQKELINYLNVYPNINKLFKPILQKHYGAVILEELGYNSSTEDVTLITAYAEHMNSTEIKKELKKSQAFVKDMILNSLDLMAYLEKTIKKADIDTQEKFEKLKINLEKQLFEKNLVKKEVSKKIKI